MSVVADVGREAARLGAVVKVVEGAATRGNGSQWAEILGIVDHHTAGGNNIYPDNIVIYGRSDLSGPLANFLITYDGEIFIVAEGPANHAGASGGWDTAPFPKTNDFNRRVLGVEVQYKGTEPMSPAQWKALAALNRAVMNVLRVGSNCIKNHNGTSIQGKVDMGRGMNGGSVVTYDINEVRRAAEALGGPTTAPAQEDDMAGEGEAINRELMGPDNTGWPRWARNLPKDWAQKLTVVGFLQSLDMDFFSFDVERPKEPGKGDTMLGHIWSISWKLVTRLGLQNRVGNRPKDDDHLGWTLTIAANQVVVMRAVEELCKKQGVDFAAIQVAVKKELG